MVSNAYLDQLRTVPAFRHCSDRQLGRIARLVDDVELPAGTSLACNGRELLLALTPTRVLVIDRRTVPAILELAPGLTGEARRERREWSPHGSRFLATT